MSRPTYDLEVPILTGVYDPKTVRASAPTEQYNFRESDAGAFREWVANAPVVCIEMENESVINNHNTHAES